jgi:hypothetical protein
VKTESGDALNFTYERDNLEGVARVLVRASRMSIPCFHDVEM